MPGLHHMHVRKRIYKNLEAYPSRAGLKRLFDRAMVFLAMVGPLATLPQVYQVFATQDARGLSLTTWLLWDIMSAVWLAYGLLHKEMPIVVSNTIYLALQSVIVVAILVYS